MFQLEDEGSLMGATAESQTRRGVAGVFVAWDTMWRGLDC